MAQVSSPCADWPGPQKVVTVSVLTKISPASFVLQTHINLAFERREHPIPLINVCLALSGGSCLGIDYTHPFTKKTTFSVSGLHTFITVWSSVNLVRCCPGKVTYLRSYDLEYSCHALALPCFFASYFTTHGHTHGHTINLDSFVAFQRGISCQRCYRCIDKVLHVKL